MDYYGLAAGVFVGNLLLYGIFFKDWPRGLGVGVIAALLVLAIGFFRP